MISNRVQVMSFLTAILISGISFAETVVIVHPSNTSEMTLDYIAKIYLAKTKKFPNDLSAKPIDRPRGSDIRVAFLDEVVQKNEVRFRSYWSRMMFTGKSMPPKTFQTDEEVKNRVASHPGAIGYIQRSAVDDSVRVVYSLSESH